MLGVNKISGETSHSSRDGANGLSIAQTSDVRRAIPNRGGQGEKDQIRTFRSRRPRRLISTCCRRRRGERLYSLTQTHAHTQFVLALFPPSVLIWSRPVLLPSPVRVCALEGPDEPRKWGKKAGGQRKRRVSVARKAERAVVLENREQRKRACMRYDIGADGFRRYTEY